MERSNFSYAFILMLFYLMLSPSKGYSFPMKDCHTSNIDLLIVFENYASEFCIHQENSKEFITAVLDVFLAPEEEHLTRLHVAVASFTSSGPVIYLPFQNGSRGEFMNKFDTLDSCHSNESPLDWYSASMDIHTSVNISLQQSYKNRNDAKDIVIFMFNFTTDNPLIEYWYYVSCEVCYDIFFVIVLEYAGIPTMDMWSQVSLMVTPISYIGHFPLFPYAVCNQCEKMCFAIGRVDGMAATDANETSIISALNRGEYVMSPLINKIESISIEVQQTFGAIPDHIKNITSINPLFSCNWDDHYVTYSSVCDHEQNCASGRDEDICEYRKCNTSEFQCVSSSRCIPIEAMCDLFEDCDDGSDELICTRLYICEGHVCGLGKCIPKHWVGDGHIDCTGSDETDDINDESISAVSTLNPLERCVFLCNRTQCVYPSQLNDGIVDCQGPEGPIDETIGALQHVSTCRTSNVHRTNVTDWAPLCFYVKDRYGTLLGCRDGSHLLDCVNFRCPEGYAKCPESYCIPSHYLNDKQPDCPRGEDEVSGAYFPDGYFDCGTKVNGPLHPDRICDGHNDCSDGADESNCHVSCAAGFTCLAGAVTVGDYDRTIPLKSLDFIDDRTRYVDLSGVNVSSVTGSGRNAQLNNLVYLLLANCSISHVGYEFADAIGRVSSIYWMNLSYNAIHEIPTQSIFRRTSNLRVLDLSHNKRLAVLSQGTFAGSKKLEEVNLSYTSIDTLHYSFFQGITFLKLLNLSHTLIDSMVGKNFPNSLLMDTLDLRGKMIRFFERDTFDGLTIKINLYTDTYSLCCPDVRSAAIPENTCHAPHDSISSCADLIGDQIQRILLWVVGIIALLGNTTVIVYRLVWDKENLKKAYGSFVVNLGISDFIMGLYLVIIAGADVVYRDVYVWNDREWRYSVTCKIAGCLATLSSETSMFFIFLVTLDRLLVVKFPFGEYRISRLGKILMIFGAWMIGIALSIIPILPIFDEDNIYTSNALCLGLPLTNERPDGWDFSMGVFIVFNFTIFLVIALGQFLIYRAMSSHRSAIAQTSARRAQDIEVAKTLFLVVFSDFMCWFPIGVMGLSALTGKEIGRDAYAWSAVLVLPVNSALNPLLYTIPVVVTKWKEFKNSELT